MNRNAAILFVALLCVFSVSLSAASLGVSHQTSDSTQSESTLGGGAPPLQWGVPSVDAPTELFWGVVVLLFAACSVWVARRGRKAIYAAAAAAGITGGFIFVVVQMARPPDGSNVPGGATAQ